MKKTLLGKSVEELIQEYQYADLPKPPQKKHLLEVYLDVENGLGH